MSLFREFSLQLYLRLLDLVDSDEELRYIKAFEVLLLVYCRGYKKDLPFGWNCKLNWSACQFQHNLRCHSQ